VYFYPAALSRFANGCPWLGKLSASGSLLACSQQRLKTLSSAGYSKKNRVYDSDLPSWIGSLVAPGCQVSSQTGGNQFFVGFNPETQSLSKRALAQDHIHTFGKYNSFAITDQYIKFQNPRQLIIARSNRRVGFLI